MRDHGQEAGAGGELVTVGVGAVLPRQLARQRSLSDSGAEFQDPREPLLFFRIAPYFLLVVSLLTFVFIAKPSQVRLLTTIGLTVVAAGWAGWWVSFHPSWTSRRGLMRIYVAGFLVLAAALTLCSGWFGIFSWIGVGNSIRFLDGRLRYAGVVAAAAVLAASQAGGVSLPITGDWVAKWLVIAIVNTVIGVLVGNYVLRTEGQNVARSVIIAELAEANARLEEMIAENAGLHAQLLTQAREAGVLDERQRMAREIHDTLAQGLAGIIRQLEAAEVDRPAQVFPEGVPGSAAGGASREWERRLTIAKELARESLAEARRSVRAIQPGALDVAQLPDAITDVANRWSEVNGVTVQVVTTGEARSLHPEVEVTLLRVAQEALSNVAKHAGAALVALTLSYMGDVVTLDVRDDGVGFRPGSVPDGGDRDAGAGGDGGGFGLIAMRQRVSRLAGRLEIESEPGAGTVVSAAVPAILPAGVATDD
jgi:signal transduction histidine kinase